MKPLLLAGLLLANGLQNNAFQENQFKGIPIFAVAFDSTSKRVVLGGKNGLVAVINIENKQFEKKFIHPAERNINFVAFVENDTHLLLAGEGTVLSLWDLKNDKEAFSFDSPIPTFSGALSSDKTLLATSNGQCIVWDLKTKKEKAKVVNKGWNKATALGPDGRWVALAPSRRGIEIWDLRFATKFKDLDKHDNVHSLALSPDGKILASGSLDRSIILWDTKTFEQLHVLKGHKGPVVGLNFSPDGKLLVSVSAEGGVRLWDMPSGKFLVEERAFVALTWYGTLSPDGRTIGVVSDDGRFKILRIEDLLKKKP
jgi:WD40 repeat protein